MRLQIELCDLKFSLGEDILLHELKKNEIRNEIIALAESLGLYTEDLDTNYMHLRGEGWSIEFCFWDDVPTYETVEMQVRGVNEPTEVFARLKKDLNARIFDMHGGKFITTDSSSGFNEWKEFTDKINLCEEI